MPSTPRSPNLRHRSIGNWLVRSISAARGAISAAAKLTTLSRIASAVSPKSKFNDGIWFASIRDLPTQPKETVIRLFLVSCLKSGQAARAEIDEIEVGGNEHVAHGGIA